MDILTILSIVSGIVGIIGVIVQFLIDKEKILAIGKNPNIQKGIRFIILLSFTFALYGYYIYPSVKIYNWEPSNYAPSERTVSKGIRLQQQPASSSFRATTYEEKTLLLDEVFPTALAISLENNKKTYVAGTYGAGLFVSAQPPSWEYLGLDNLVITKIVLDRENPYLIWAATNLGVAFSNDHGVSWNMSGPIQDLVTDLVSDPIEPWKMVAGTLNGVYFSSDAGTTWIGPYLEGDVITSIKIAPSNSNRIYISCLHGKIYRSNDAGKSWNQIREPNEFGSAPIDIDPENPDFVYIGPSDLGLFRSTNAGETWEYLGLKGASISSILVSNFPQKTIFVGTDEARGLYVSKDDGKTWQNSGDLIDPVVTMINDIDATGAVIVSTTKSGILKTTDLGQNWSSLGLASLSVITDFSPQSLLIREGNPDSLIASSFYAKGLYKSDDSGFSWSPLAGNSDLLRYSVQQILLDPTATNHLIISAYGGNVLESDSNGDSWENITSNLPLSGYAPVALTSTGELFAGPSDQGVWKKSPNENLWMPSGLLGYSIEAIWVGANNANVYALDNGNVLHVSYNGGETWTEPPYLFRAVTMRSLDETLIGVSESYEVLKSTDNARTWQKVAEISPSARALVPSLTFDNKTGVLYISYDKVLLRGKDTETTWDEYVLPEYGEIQAALGERAYFLGNQALHVSDNYGETFRPVKYKSLIASSTQQIQFNNDVFLLGSRDGIFASFDNLKSWSQTSIGAGNDVLALTKVNMPEALAVALLANGEGVELATSLDGKLWSLAPTPCKSFEAATSFLSYSSPYFSEITNGDEPIWQLECSDPKGILILAPNRKDESLLFSTDSLNMEVSDALFLPDNSIYVLISNESTAKIYHSSDFGKKWQLVGQFNPHYLWELSDDSRSDGILIIKEGEVFQGSLRPEPLPPIMVYVAFLFSVILCLIVSFMPGLLKEFIANTKWLLSWLVSNQSEPGVTTSPLFLIIVCPIIILLTVLFFQITPQIGVLSQIASYQNFAQAVNFIANLIIRSSIPLFTLDGAIFVGILLAYSLIVVFISFILLSTVPLNVSLLFQ